MVILLLFLVYIMFLFDLLHFNRSIIGHFWLWRNSLATYSFFWMVISSSIANLNDYISRTCSCGRGSQYTDSHNFHNAVDVSYISRMNQIYLDFNFKHITGDFYFLSRPTCEFPHPFSHVKQPAGYRVSWLLLQGSYLLDIFLSWMCRRFVCHFLK